MENINICVACGSTDHTLLFNCIDRVSSGEKFPIVTCRNCSHQFTQTRPSQEEAGKYYQSDQYVSHTDDKNGIVPFLYRKIRKINLKWKLRIINKLIPKGSLLDYGCGLGTFLAASKENGWHTTGMDISEDARNVVKKRYHIEVFPIEFLFTSEKEKYDIVSLWHVLEHVYEIDKTIEALKAVTKTGGYILIAVPNNKSYDAIKYKSNWDAYDVPRHLWHFNKNSITTLFNKHQLQLTETKPMIFDSYYVSIRSEMHKGNKLYFITGMFWGLISHIKAMFTGEYSSQLYIFKKV